MRISYLLILGIIVTFSFGVDNAFGASVSAREGTSVPGCENTNQCFVPYEVSIPIGGQVTWTNDDSAAHTVTGGSGADGPSGVFDSSLFMAGTTFSHQFDESGIYPYFCMVHPWMEGIVKVGNPPYSPPKSSEPPDIIITVEMNGPQFFYLDESNQIVRATVEIQNYSPSDGQYFMKVTHLPTGMILKDFEIYPKPFGDELWRAQIAYPILESEIKAGDQTILGEFEIEIRADFSTQMGSTTFSIFESQNEHESFPEPPHVSPTNNDPITVSTNKNHYEEGESIIISGKVSPIIKDVPIFIQVWFEGNMIDVAQFFPAQDGIYSHTLIAEKPSWKQEGEYLIRVSHGEGNIAQTTFTFETSNPPLEPEPTHEPEPTPEPKEESSELEKTTSTNPNLIKYENARYELDRCQSIQKTCNERCAFNSLCDANDCTDSYGCTSERINGYYELLNQQRFEEENCGSGTHLENGLCVLDGEASVCGAGTVMINGKCVPESNQDSFVDDYQHFISQSENLVDLEKFFPDNAVINEWIFDNETAQVVGGTLVENEKNFTIMILQITTEEERDSLWNTLKNSRQQLSYPEDIETLSATCIEGWLDEQMKQITCIKDDFGIVITSFHSVLPIMEEILSKMENSPLPNGGGCLIATATYGSELAPQVQQLRELRDNKLLQTESGSAFMESFNDFYYSFSPAIADYERENSYFKEGIKLAITPMISSLSILNYVDMDSETEVLGYGISLILLNIGMYVGVPVIGVIAIRRF